MDVRRCMSLGVARHKGMHFAV